MRHAAGKHLIVALFPSVPHQNDDSGARWAEISKNCVAEDVGFVAKPRSVPISSQVIEYVPLHAFGRNDGTVYQQLELHTKAPINI